jgi:MFS transporter, PPP family, 3-phenylpropionic acid transporter
MAAFWPPCVFRLFVTSDLPRKRLSSFYFWYYALLGITHPFWPLFLSHRQFSATEIGLLLSVQMGTRIVSPNLWGWLADRTGKRMATIRVGSLLGLVSFCGIFVAESFYGMLVVMAAYSFFWNAVMPQFEALTLDYLKETPQSYSRIRVWGSVGFIAAVVLGGYWFQARIEDFRLAGAAFLAMIWVTTLYLRQPPHQDHHHDGSTFLSVVRQWPVMAFFIVSFLLQVAHGIYYSFYSLYLEDAGYMRSQVGWFWGLSVLAEIGLFLVMHRLLTNWTLWSIFVLSLLLTTFRWLIIAFFEESLAALIFAQCLHAFSFGACHAVAIEYLRRFFTVNHRGQAQAMYTSVSFGAGGALGALSGGLLWDFSGPLVFVVAAGVSLLAALLAYVGLDYRRQTRDEMRALLRD